MDCTSAGIFEDKKFPSDRQTDSNLLGMIRTIVHCINAPGVIFKGGGGVTVRNLKSEKA